MPYDPTLDKELAKREINIDGKVWEVSLKSYNGGEAKVNVALKDSRFPVKRLPVNVFLAVADAVKEMNPA